VRWSRLCVTGALAALSLPALAGDNPALKNAKDLGVVESTRPVPVTVWLKLQDRAGLELKVAAQQKGAPYLSDSEFQEAHAPRDSDVGVVSRFLQSQGMQVTGVGPHNMYVRAVGPASRVGAAFQVSVHDYALGGRTFHAAAQPPTVPATIAPLVASVGGLGGHLARPQLARPVDPETGSPFAPRPLSSSPDGLFFSAQCFRSPEVHQFSGANSGGNVISATYAGNRYGSDITSGVGNLPPCGYQPSDLQNAYGLSQLYSAGWNGAGTTIAIVDAFGSKYIQNDAALFSALMGLPPPDLTVIGTPTEPTFDPTDPNNGWADETTLDVEWVHAIAPGAKILLFVAPSNYDSDLFAAIAAAEAYPNVVAISNSWSEWESSTDVASRAAADSVLIAGAAKGISINFSTGDAGNETVNLGYADVNYPASSPYATAIGGVSTALTSSGRLAFQTSWGNNLTRIVDSVANGGVPFDPPQNLGFVFGGGGGISNVYAKPAFQRALPGTRRMVPETVDAAGDQSIFAIGGTSLSCPMFSALWGIAAQRAGNRIGQAARSVYTLPAGAVTDVTPVDSAFDVAGFTTDAVNGTLIYNSWELASPLQNVGSFFSAFYNGTSTRWYVITFGTDTSLSATPGYDLATGVGTPNPPAFVQAFRGR